jgi:Spy/CpxP family protein refolding chaperone
MNKLVSVAFLTVALTAMGCQTQANRPPEAPTAPAPPPPPGPGPMAQHPGPGGPWAHPAPGQARQHRGEDRMDRNQGRGDRNKVARGRGNKAGRMGMMHQGQGPMGPGRDPAMMQLAALGVHFYPPPMLIHRSQEIGLTPDQVTKIRQEMLGTQAKAVDARAKVEKARIEVARLLTADKVDEKAINAQLDDVAKAQAELQKLHIGTMLRVRGLLTAEQRQKLDERKPKARQGKPGPGAPGATSSIDDDEADDLDDEDDFDEDDEAEG